MVAVIVAAAFVVVNSGDDDSDDSVTVMVNGSTTVDPIMEDVKEAYEKINSNVTININATGSGAGAKAVLDGTADLGMMSREAKDEEVSQGLVTVAIGKDGIAVLINSSAQVSALTLEQVQKIYTGEITNWSEVGGADKSINVLGRESTSGTRSAFEEILGIENECVSTMLEVSSNNALLTSVEGTDGGIAYLSLGIALKEADTSKVAIATIGGVEATIDNVVDGSYTIQRNLNLAYKEGNDDKYVQNIIDYFLSEAGQQFVEDNDYIPVGASTVYVPLATATVMVNGSTTVDPIMEDVKEAFEKAYSNVTININATGSGAGAKAVLDGTADLGMMSREAKDEEVSQGLVTVAIGKDGIAVLINSSAGVSALTLEQVQKIYTGEITNWSEVGGADKSINVLGRESTSGTRSAFEEILGIENECVSTMLEVSSNNALLTAVEGTDGGIAYLSLGIALKDADTSKVVIASIGGVKATIDNVVDGSYTIQRNLNLAYKEGNDNAYVQAIIAYFLSEDGQKFVEANDYIAVARGEKPWRTSASH